MAEAALGAAQVVVMVVAVARPIVARGGASAARDGGGQGSPRWWPPWTNLAAPQARPRCCPGTSKVSTTSTGLAEAGGR